MLEQSITPRYDLGSIVEIINKYGSRSSYFANEIVSVDVRCNKVFVRLKGCDEELWVDNADTPEEANKIADRLLSVVASIRMNGPDRLVNQ